MPDQSRTDRWVARCNAMARELDDTADSIHPSAWPEALKALQEKYRKVAGGNVGRQIENRVV